MLGRILSGPVRRLSRGIAGVAEANGFFDRKEELEWLRNLLHPRQGCPADLVIVGGPKDSGKTALISEFVRRQRLNEYSGVSFKADLRGAEISPGGMASLLKPSVFEYIDDAKTIFEKVKHERNLGPLLSAIMSYGIKSYGNIDVFPTLIIDEANLLRYWTRNPEMNKALEQLMEYLVLVTKQEGLMNVVLLSSENFFQSWVEKMVSGSDRCTAVTIGDLTEDEARAFLVTSLDRKEQLTDELWSDIFSVVGGRMLLLARAAKYVDKWEKLKRTLLPGATRELEKALDPTSLSPGIRSDVLASAPAWTRQQWLHAMKVVVEHEDGVTPYAKLRDQFTPTVVDSFIEYDLLSYRPYAGWSRDFSSRPAEDFPLVMPSSRVHYNAMKALVNKFSY